MRGGRGGGGDLPLCKKKKVAAPEFELPPNLHKKMVFYKEGLRMSQKQIGSA